MLNEAWTEPGFCVPNLDVYPHQWLWDSCFHSLIWAELDDGRAIVELESVLASQYESGFVPHMTYWNQPSLHQDFWGRSQTSSITQPPMFGHAAAVLHRRGFEISSELCQRIEKAFGYLLRSRPRTPDGLVPVFHPWESGCDDSPRWDVVDQTALTPQFDADAWRSAKSEMVQSLRYGADGSPVANPLFEVGSSGFNALILFNFAEFSTIPWAAASGTMNTLRVEYEKLRSAFVDSWRPQHQTWIDDSVQRASRCRTADALLGLLIDPQELGFEQLRSPEALGGDFGVAGVHRNEAAYDPASYWRGPSWPQLNYLLTLASVRAGEHGLASQLRRAALRGAQRSGIAEYWNPESGQGYGATPQTWTGLALVSTEIG